MSRIPDCRKDENYNEKYLNGKDKGFIGGFDCAVESMNCFLEGNTDVFPEFAERFCEKDIELIKKCLNTWVESSRNELITTMIDAMDDDEYDTIKEKVDGRFKEEVGQGIDEN